MEVEEMTRRKTHEFSFHKARELAILHLREEDAEKFPSSSSKQSSTNSNALSKCVFGRVDDPELLTTCSHR